MELVGNGQASDPATRAVKSACFSLADFSFFLDK